MAATTRNAPVGGGGVERAFLENKDGFKMPSREPLATTHRVNAASFDVNSNRPGNCAFFGTIAPCLRQSGSPSFFDGAA